MNNIEQLAQDIMDRINAVDQRLSEALTPQRVEELIRQHLNSLADDEEFVRKIRFARPEPRLEGSKFARWGLTVADVEFLHDLQESLRGQRKIDSGFYPGPSDELRRAFETISRATYLSEEEVRRIDRQALDNLWPRIPRDLRLGLSREDWVERHMRAMDTQESGFGQQLVGAQYVGDLWMAARPDSRVFGLISTFEMTAPTAYLPVEVDIPEMLFVTESTTNNAANYATVKTGSQRVQVDAKKFVIHQMWSGEMEEDSILPFVPFLRAQAAKAVAYYADSLVLNGDTTNAATGNINSDDADPVDTKHYLAFDGIRHAALVDNTSNAIDVAGPVTLDTFRKLRGTMLDATRLVDWGHPTDSADLIFVADPETADRVAMLDEMISFGVRQQSPNLLNGEVGRVIGHPLLSSIAVPKTLANGKASATPSNNVKGQIVAFNRRGFVIGWRRRVKLESERLPATDQTRIVYSLRLGFGRFTPTGAAPGIEAAAVAYNISL